MNFIEKIVERKIYEVNKAKENLPLKDLIKISSSSKYEKRNFAEAIKRNGEIKIIAEIKKSSPSAGNLSDDNFNPISIAKDYETSGANAISVLTDFEFFKGRKQYLPQVKNAVKIPVLRKDFIIDEYQIYESKYLGADAILLIVRIIDDVQLEDYIWLANELGLDVLVEVYDKHDLARALKISPYPKIIGINNRDLATFQTEINISLEMSKYLPEDVIKVSESGIKTRDDVLKISDAGFDAILIGETLMRATDKNKKMKELLCL